MANQVTDNRTNVSTGESATNWEDLGGTALAVDTEISYDTYTGSIGGYVTTTQDGTFYNNTTTGLFSSGDHAYLLINCGVVSLLDAVAAAPAGLTVRVTGATATDWAEFDLFGSDQWPTAFSGGWIQIVVDIDELLLNPSRTNGTAPTVGNIQRFGVTYTTATVMPRMTDNIWVGGFKILGSATPALIIEGRDGGTTDWDWASVAAVAAVQLSAVLLPGTGGTFICRGPIQFGISDASTHAFTESNKTLIFDDQEVMLDGFYGLSALNDTGSNNINFGVKTGTGDAATGAQGGAIQAASTRARWDMDFNDPDLTAVNFYGVQMVHGGDFLLDDPACSFISSAYIDCTSALVSNSEQLRVSVVNANTADGVAFMTTDDLSDIVFSSFNFSDGHAVELTTPNTSSQNNKGNKFVGYGADGTNDAAVYNNSGAGLVTISVTDQGSGTTTREGASATTTVESAVTVNVAGLTWGTPVKLIARETLGAVTDGDTLSTGFADSAGLFSYSHNDQGSLDISVVARNQGVAVAAIADDGGAFTNETDEAHSNTTADMTLLPAVPVANDAYYFGHDEEFPALKLDISTALTQSSPHTIVWEYWNGAWVALSGVVDGTNEFETAGENKVTWTPPGDWATTTVTGELGALYYVRARLSVLGTITQVPVGRKITLDVSRYFPYDENREIVTGTGLNDNASWTKDNISIF